MNLLLPLFGQDNGDAAGAAAAGLFGLCFLVIELAILGLFIAGMWKIFAKAGQPGWMSLIPILNMYILVQISGREVLWFVLLLVPCVNIVALVLVWMDVAKKFGQGPGFGLGLAFLPFIFAPILGFGSARYNPAA